MICKDKFNQDGECKFYIWPKDEDGKDNIGFCEKGKYFRCIEELIKQPYRLNYSAISSYIKCKRLFWLCYIKGIKIKPQHTSNALKLGVLWDTYKQYYRLGDDLLSDKLNEVINKYNIDDYEIMKVKAIIDVAKEYGIDYQVEEVKGKSQEKVIFTPTIEYAELDKYREMQLVISLVFDRKYYNYFEEDKFSSDPYYYLNISNINTQIGTYFLSDENLEYVVMKIVRVPLFKKIYRNTELSIENYYSKCFDDIIGRPAYYFTGFNKNTKTYGKKFYRREFDLNEIIELYKTITLEILFRFNKAKDEIEIFNNFYKEHCNCFNPWPCEYITVCKYNVVSEEMFYIDKIEKNKTI